MLDLNLNWVRIHDTAICQGEYLQRIIMKNGARHIHRQNRGCLQKKSRERGSLREHKWKLAIEGGQNMEKV